MNHKELLKQASIDQANRLGWNVEVKENGSVQFSLGAVSFSVPGKKLYYEIYDFYRDFDFLDYMNSRSNVGFSEILEDYDDTVHNLKKLYEAIGNCETSHLKLIGKYYSYSKKGKLVTLKSSNQSGLLLTSTMPDTELYNKYELQGDCNGNIAYICKKADKEKFAGTIITEAEIPCDEPVPFTVDDIAFEEADLMSVPEFSIF